MANEIPLYFESSGAYAVDLSLAQRSAAGSLKFTATSFSLFGATPVTQPADAAQAVSVPAYGAMYTVTGATTTISGAGTYVKVGNTTTQDAVSSFTHTANRLTYTGATTLLMRVTANAVIGYSGGAGAKTIALRLAKNDVSIAATQSSLVMAAATDRDCLVIQGLISLATNDYIELFCANITDTNSVVVDQLYMNITATHDPTLENALRAALVSLGAIKGSA